MHFYNILFYEININFHTKNINEVILLPGKLYKTQTEIMTRDARSFTRSNHTKSCRLPVRCFHKLGWQETHTFRKKLLKNSAAPIIIIGDSIATPSSQRVFIPPPPFSNNPPFFDPPL